VDRRKTCVFVLLVIALMSTSFQIQQLIIVSVCADMVRNILFHLKRREKTLSRRLQYVFPKGN
jgi:hypothetical protein